LAQQGQAEEGIAQIREGLTASYNIGSEGYRSLYFGFLAEAYRTAGQPKEGLTVLAEALTVVEKTGERLWEAELYRLKGELLLAQEIRRLKAKGKSQKSEPPGTQEAEACFLKALDVARKQQAKSLELRASRSLACLWGQQGKCHEAHTLLAEIYNWFTEGFDTKDLQEAKVLLEALA
jgi:predicted ATPase